MRTKRKKKQKIQNLRSNKKMLSKDFIVQINGVPCTIIRSKHVTAQRFGTFRDYGLNKIIYAQILSLGTPYIDKSKEFIITWEHNAFTNAIAGQFLTKNSIRIISACVNFKSKPEKIYGKHQDNRYHVGSVKYDNKD